MPLVRVSQGLLGEEPESDSTDPLLKKEQWTFVPSPGQDYWGHTLESGLGR